MFVCVYSYLLYIRIANQGDYIITDAKVAKRLAE